MELFSSKSVPLTKFSQLKKFTGKNSGGETIVFCILCHDVSKISFCVMLADVVFLERKYCCYIL